MENEKKTNELLIYDLCPGRIVTIVRSPVLPISDKTDTSYRGERLKVLGKDEGYAILERPECSGMREPMLLRLSDWGFADASILDKPKTVWITADEVAREGKKSTLAAVEVSIKKYRQVYEASDKELQARSNKIIRSVSYCGLCQRFSNQHCKECLLGNNTSDTCCPEWRACQSSWGNWPVFRPAVLKLIERLEKERDKLLKPKPYVFQAGDVVRTQNDHRRIIIYVADKGLCSFGRAGSFCCSGQEQFEYFGYVKIGVLSDFITQGKKG